MYCGLPVVANGVGGIPELIEHGKTGYVLYDYDIRKAVEYLEELIRDRDRRISLGMEGRMTAHEKFNLAGMVNQYRELYES
jgi:glycosyltransferase involved in cell wall biosynthesis